MYPTRQQLPRRSNRTPARVRVLTSKNRTPKNAHIWQAVTCVELQNNDQSASKSVDVC